MSYEYTESEDGSITLVGGKLNLRTDNQLREKDMKFLEKIFSADTGDYHYNAVTISELQRKFGSRFQTGLLNGLLNYRDFMKEKSRKLEIENENMINVIEKVGPELKKLREENQRLHELLAQQQVISDAQQNYMEKQIQKDITTQRIIDLHNAGMSQRKIAELLSVSVNRVSDAIKRYKT